MGKKFRRNMLALVVVMGAALTIWGLAVSREPAYLGRPLSNWLTLYDAAYPSAILPTLGNQPTLAGFTAADQAVRQMGTKAIPVLLRRLACRDSDLGERISLMLQKQDLFKVPYSRPLMKNLEAAHALRALGTLASASLPKLLSIYALTETNSYHRVYVTSIFAALGPAASEAVPTLIAGLSSGLTAPSGAVPTRGYRGEMVRASSALALGEIHSHPEISIPALAVSLSDPSLEVKSLAARSLGKFGAAAQPAISQLVGLLKTGESNSGHSSVRSFGRVSYDEALGWRPVDLRQVVVEALNQISPGMAAESAVPVLVENLRLADFENRINSMRALRWFGTNAAPAIPELLTLFKRQNGSTDFLYGPYDWRVQELADTINAIDPLAAGRAGVH